MALQKVTHTTALLQPLHICNSLSLFSPLTAGQDYNATEETFTLQGGIRELFSVNIPILDDGIDEFLETFMTRIAAADTLPPMIYLDPIEGEVEILGTINVSPSPFPSPSRMYITTTCFACNMIMIPI